MLSPTAIRAAALYVPLIAAALAGIVRKRRPRQFAACLLSTLWTLPTLLILQRLNLHYFWWTFQPTSGPTLLAMPLEFYFGWIILWGLVPQLTFPTLSLPEVIALMAASDLWFLFFCHPAIHLQRFWLTGEALALAIVLSPALCVARWTLNNTHLNLRATQQVFTSALLFLYLLPELVFTLPGTRGWSPLLRMHSIPRQLGIQIVLLVAVPGVSAVTEFAHRGRGTPIPYDPPRRLVTSGVYRYIGNPMQFFCALTMLLWAAMLRSPWFAAASIMSTLFSAGIAHWDESADLADRFPQSYDIYRRAVPDWRIRWRPHHSGPPACLYIAGTCGPCSELRAFLETRHPIGLNFIPAETLPAGSIRRLRYDPADGAPPTEGVRALARALEHLNFGWAYCGFFLRLPIVWQSVQLLGDAVGLDPRVLKSATK